MKLGLNLAVFNNRPLEQALDAAVALGIETVEINCDSRDPCTPLDRLREAGTLAGIRSAVQTRGLEISGVGNHLDAQLIGGPFHRDTDAICPGDKATKRNYGIARLLETARVAADLEVDTVIGFTGCEDWSRWFPWPDKQGWDRELEEFVTVWQPLLDEFQRLGVRFAHEPHPKQLAYDLETALRVTAALDHRLEWGFNLDLANLSLAGVNPAAFVQALPERIYHVHAKDLEFVDHNRARSGWQSHGPWGRTDRGFRFRIPGWGGLNWKAILSELQLAGYRGPLSIEHEDPVFGRQEGVAKAVVFLAPLLIREPAEPEWW